MSLRNHAWWLAQLGRQKEALDAIGEAVSIRRKLAAAWPDAFRDVLADSLLAMSELLKELEHWHEARTVVDEAVGIYRQLASSSPEAFTARLAYAERLHAELPSP
jgi:hypothetical protein